MARHCEGGTTEAISQQRKIASPTEKRYRNDVLNRKKELIKRIK